MRRAALPILALVASVSAACGGGGSPTAPSAGSPPAAPSPTPAPSPSPAPAASPSPSTPPSPAPSVVVRMATIQGANGHTASGTARILRTGDSYVLELGSDFRIDSGNNDVYLAQSRSTVGAGDLNLGNMKAISGQQTYPMPHDGAGYTYVVLWCRPFQITIGVGELR